MKDKKWWHIRYYFKSRHNALIVDEDTSNGKGRYHYMDITTSPSKKESYISLSKPINKKSDISYVRKYVGNDYKKKFSSWISKYEIDNEDMDKIELYLKNRNKNNNNSKKENIKTKKRKKKKCKY